MTLQEYLTSLRHKTVAVIGIGVSNTPLLRRLLAEGIAVTACDRSSREKLGPLADELEAAGATLHLGEGYLDGLTQDVIFRTPGLRPDVPQLLAAQRQGSTLTSEMEVFFQVCPCHMIAVTGSDGKTTTTTIIAELLKAAGRTVHVGGNIGQPLLCQADDMEPEDWAVLELSSFPADDHGPQPPYRRGDQSGPQPSGRPQGHGGVCGGQGEHLPLSAPRRHRRVQSGQRHYPSAGRAGRGDWSAGLQPASPSRKQGVFLRGEDILCRHNGQERPDHDARRTSACRAFTTWRTTWRLSPPWRVWCRTRSIRDFARTFNGVEHRIELVRTYHGVRYYNDSIASSPSRTIAGLRSFPEQVILIAGGYDKHIPFDVLGPEIVEHVKLLVLCGATAGKIRAAVEQAPGYRPDHPEILEVTPFQRAVEAARDRAQPGDVVTLSPACAAFDQFKNFMERGKTFKAIVNGWRE